VDGTVGRALSSLPGAAEKEVVLDFVQSHLAHI
jgi:hypothetical protein